MNKLPFAARLYVSAVIALGACLLLVLTPWSPGLTQPGLFFSLLLLSALCAAFKVNLPVIPVSQNVSTLSVSFAVDFASLLLIGPHLTMLISAVGAWTQCTIRPKRPSPVHRVLFTMAAQVVTVQASGAAFHLAGGNTATDAALALASVLAAISVWFIVLSGLTAGATALSSGKPLLGTWRDTYVWTLPGYFIGGMLAAGAGFLLDRNVRYFAFLAAIPMSLTYRAYRIYLGRVEEEQKRVQDMANLHLATVEALALAIDAKDQRPHLHIQRMCVYATALGRAFSMTPEEIEGLRTAAQLHDIGKLAIPEHILAKPGALTPDEVRKVRVHPVVGAQIIAQVPFPYPVAPLILAHHERWDGRGYPSGVKGEAIPLGARILAVIDFYDALVTDRPYHPAVSQEAALQLVHQEAGRAFDPLVAETFVRLAPGLGDLAEPSSLLTPRVIEGLSANAGEQGPGDQPRVLQDIAVAHREIYSLYQIAQVMGTSLGVTETMKVIASKLTTLVPFSCFALYLSDEANETLECRFATGTDADILRRVVVKNGHGATGWVARNRRPLVNARPEADLEAAAAEAIASTRLQSALMCPLLYADQVIGTLAVYHTEAGFYTEDHGRLLDCVCQQAAAVIANSITFEKTQQESLTDPLTGLPNTRYLTMNLERELARAERLKSEVAFIVMDLDDFKEINDRYGHQAGDRALQRVGAVLRNATRPYDICVRYAGDEFIVLLPGCAQDEAATRLHELQSAIDGIRFEARPGRIVTMSMSAGCAIYPVDGGGYESLLAIADARMYRDKTKRKKARSRAAGAMEEDAAADLAETDLQRRAGLGIL